MMRFFRARSASLVTVLLAAGCAETALPTTPDAADAAPACATRPALVAPAACAGLTELATPAHRIASDSGVTAYALRSIAAGVSRVRPACATEPWQDGGEATVRFTAPTGGRWRLIARGERLAALRAARGCGDAGVCAGFPTYHGAHVTTEIAVDVQAQRGEAFAVLLDGCPAGEACAYDLRAERVGPLSCALSDGDASPCAESEVCALDACDAERFSCSPLAPTRLDSARVQADRATATGYVTGRLRAAPAGALRRDTPALMVSWQRADGTLLPASEYVGLAPLDDAFALGPARVPADAVRARVWLYEGERPVEAQMADGLDVPVEAWRPGAAGDRCGEALFARCAHGLRCDAGVCAPSSALRVTGLRAWRDTAGPSLRLRVEGEGFGEPVTQALVELVSASGATLASLPGRTLFARHAQPSQVPFTATLVLSREPDLGALAAAVRVRVRVVDTMARASEPFEAALEDTAVQGVAASCAALSSSCGAGLMCSDDRCEPTPAARTCDLTRGAAIWAPSRAGAWSIEGVSRTFGGATSCLATRTASEAVAEFVAPTSGAYVFEAQGIMAIEVKRGCDADAPTPLCVRSPAAPRIEVTLAAGERAVLTVLGERYEAPWSVTVQVP